MDKFNMYALVMDSLNDGAPICVNNDGIRYLNSEWENVHTSIEEIRRLIDEYDEWYEGWCSVDCDI